MRMSIEDRNRLDEIVQNVIDNPKKYLKIEITDSNTMVVVEDNETIAEFFQDLVQPNQGI